MQFFIKIDITLDSKREDTSYVHYFTLPTTTTYRCSLLDENRLSPGIFTSGMEYNFTKITCIITGSNDNNFPSTRW